MNEQAAEKIDYPWVTFRLLNGTYCISSQYIETMTTGRRFHPLPEMSAELRGMLDLNGRMLPVLDLRALLGLASAQDELEVFRGMKQAHISWVKELHRCAETGEPFTLAEDPHLCTFGQWYYSYQPESHEIRILLNRIEEPHEKLHHCAQRLRECRTREEVESLLTQVDGICRDHIVPLLNKLIATFQDADRGITIVLEKAGKSVGALVDQVMAIYDFRKDENCKYSEKIGESPYVSRIITAGDGMVYLEMDVDALMNP